MLKHLRAGDLLFYTGTKHFNCNNGAGDILFYTGTKLNRDSDSAAVRAGGISNYTGTKRGYF